MIALSIKRRLCGVASSGRFVSSAALYPVASTVQALLALGGVPHTTKILNPSDFGVFALVTGVGKLNAHLDFGIWQVVGNVALATAAPLIASLFLEADRAFS
jgi:hypothetical protein